MALVFLITTPAREIRDLSVSSKLPFLLNRISSGMYNQGHFLASDINLGRSFQLLYWTFHVRFLRSSKCIDVNPAPCLYKSQEAVYRSATKLEEISYQLRNKLQQTIETKTTTLELSDFC